MTDLSVHWNGQISVIIHVKACKVCMLYANVRLIIHDPIPQYMLHVQGKATAARDDYTSNSPSFRQESTNQRALQLQPFIQQQCSAAVQSMGQELDAQLKQLGQPGMDMDGAKLVEQALLLGLSQASPEAMPCHEYGFLLFRCVVTPVWKCILNSKVLGFVSGVPDSGRLATGCIAPISISALHKLIT